MIKQFLGTIALCAGIATSAQAAIVEFAATLTPEQEGGSLNLNGATPSGTAGLVFDTESNEFGWVISFEGLSSEAVAAHFHAAPVGVNGGVRVDIPSNSVFSGLGSTDGIFVGGATLTDDQETELLSGLFYINIHTPNNGGGEIRGQVLGGTFNPVPLPAAAWLMIPALGFLGRRRRAA